MGSRDEVVAALLRGHSPGKIMRERGISLKTVLGYLDELVGKGKVRRSDILLSIPSSIRVPALAILQERHPSTLGEFRRDVGPVATGADPCDLEVIWLYGDARLALGDAYEDLRVIETCLHELARMALERAYGPGELGWWRKGVPGPVRRKCQERREEDPAPEPHPYAYTDLLDLRAILERNWDVVSPFLRSPARASRRALLDDLLVLNGIRRVVMHPARGGQLAEDDFELLARMRDAFQRSDAGRNAPPSPA